MADGHNQIFEPDTLMPERFFAVSGVDDGAGNERALMLAILRDAVECHQKYALTRDARGREIFGEADEWIYSNDREWPFSFENICDVLGVNPAYIRTGLGPMRRAYRQKQRRIPRIAALERRDEVAPSPGEDRRLRAAS